ncbi:MAG: IS5 family transposase [bacterium]
MIRYQSSQQQTLSEFDWPFQVALDEDNRWVKLSKLIPWDDLAAGYHQSLSKKMGRRSKDARLVIGAVIIKHRLCLSDRETVKQIQENPYLQYFVGLSGYQMEAPFAASLLVDVRKRMGAGVFEVFHQSIIDAVAKHKAARKASSTPSSSDDDDDHSDGSGQGKTEAVDSADSDGPHQGHLLLDATVAEQAIRYPTDISLLNEAREFSEQIIDHLYSHTEAQAKPRTYRRNARKQYLALVKQKRPSAAKRRKAIKGQLQYLRRNLNHIKCLLGYFPIGRQLPLPGWLLYRYWVIQHLYDQQWQMYRSNTRRCADRIVSISQPYIRPIKRGKVTKSVEFGAKLSVSMNADGLSCVDEHHWHAQLESQDLPAQVERYRQRYGCYPEKVIADPVYGTRANRDYLKAKGIHFAGKALGRPKKVTLDNALELKQLKQQRHNDYLLRIPIEGKFGQGKHGYRLNYIRAKRADTSLAWINSIFLVMNLVILLRIFFGPKIDRLVSRYSQIKHRVVNNAQRILPNACFRKQHRKWNCSGFVIVVTL